jgi:hypothetical protein
MSEPEQYFADESCCMAFWNNVAIIDVWADMSPARMRKLGEAYAKLYERYPAGIVVLALIQSSTPVASAEARNESARVLKELGDAVLHTAMVIEAQGVLALMLRSVVRSLNTLMRNTRISLPDTVERAARALQPWVVSNRTGNIAADLIAAAGSVRARHEVRARNFRASRQ